MNKPLLLLISVLLLATAAVGCSKYDRNMNANQFKARTTQDNTIMDNDFITRRNNENQSLTMDQVTSDRISQQVHQVNNVKKATIFVHNNNLVAGIDVHDNADAASVEQAVKQSLEKSYPAYRVHVTANKDFHERISTLQSQMMPLDGRPVQNFANDVEVLIQDMGNAITAPFRNNKAM